MLILLSPLIRLISLLPMRWLYALSDILYPVVYHLLTYRRVTVRRNLSMSFPDHTSREIRAIEKEFYRHFCDLIVESIKAFSISRKELEQRVTVSDFDLLTKLMDKGKGVCGVLGHMGNWEWAVLRLAQVNPYPTHALYQPSSSRRFDRWLKRNRERFGALLVSTRSMRSLLRKASEGPVAVGFLGDQTPVEVDKAHWMYFLRQPTPVYTGTARMAVRYDMAVVYLSITKPARGRYHISLELITDQPRELGEAQITEVHTKRLEADILRQPGIWLWSHRRWKRAHLRPPELELSTPS